MTSDALNIRARRAALGWTQVQLADAAGLPYAAYVSTAERGLKTPADASRKILVALEVEEGRRAQVVAEESASVKRRALAAAVPDGPEWRALRAALATRAIALLDENKGDACDALLELLPEAEADRLLIEWLDAQIPDPVESKDGSP